VPDNPLEWKEVKERAEAIRDRLIGPSQVDDLTPPEALISGIVSEGVLTVLLGKWGSGKSFLALDWACCVASGKWWNRRRVVRGPVIYVYAEGVAGLKARKQAWEKANNVILDSFELTWYPAGLQLLDEVERLAFAAVAQGEGCALVILDTLNRNIPGGDENTSRDMGALIHAADLIRSAVPKCTVLVLHHPGREGDHGRGHSSLDGAADTLLMVKKDGDVVTLYCDKQKDGAEFEPIRLHLTEVGDSCVLLPKGDGSNEAETRTEEKLLSVLWQHRVAQGLRDSRIELLPSVIFPGQKGFSAQGRHRAQTEVPA
jgi:hypothetical protein